jgi:hypothetical protein
MGTGLRQEDLSDDKLEDRLRGTARKLAFVLRRGN